LTLNEDPIWAGGAKEQKDSIESDHDCPYYENEAQVNFWDRELLFICLAGLVLIAVPVLVSIRRKRVKVAPLIRPKRKRAFLTFADLFFMFYLVIETIQLFYLGPSFDHYANVSLLPQLFNLRIDLMFGFGSSAFFYLITTFSCLIFLYLLAVYMGLKSGRLRLHDIIVTTLGCFANFMVFFAFIPITSAFLDVYSCNIQVTVNDQTRYYLSEDCNTECGSVKHTTLLLLAGSCLLFFIPVALPQRIGVQIDAPGLNIQPRAEFLLSKTTIIVAFIIGKKVLMDYPALQSVFAVLIMTPYALSLREKHLFNVPGVQLMQKTLLSLLVVEFWITMASFFVPGIDDIYFSALLMVLWFSIIIYAVIKNRLIPRTLFTGFHHSSTLTILTKSYFTSTRSMTMDDMRAARKKVAYEGMDPDSLEDEEEQEEEEENQTKQPRKSKTTHFDVVNVEEKAILEKPATLMLKGYGGQLANPRP